MVNFLALEYRDDGEKNRRMGCLEHLECLERTGHSKRMEHSVRHSAEKVCAKRSIRIFQSKRGLLDYL